VGITLASAVWWTALRPKHQEAPQIPFSEPGSYTIRSQIDFLDIEKKEDGLEIGIRREYDSPSGNGFGGAALPPSWVRSDKWFAHVDSEHRVWLFDGISDLKVLVMREDGVVFFDPSKFTPESTLLDRLPKTIVQAQWPK